MLGSAVDGIVIGRFLGSDSMAAFGIISPIVVFYTLMSGMLASGSRNRFTRLIGAGRADEAQRVFSLAFLVTIGYAAALMIICLVFATPITTLLGASKNAASLLPKARAYLIGIAIGLPALNGIKILTPFLPIDNDRNLPVIASFVLTITDIILDLIVVLVLHGDTFEMGLATSISQYVAFFVLLIHFGKKNKILRLTFRNLPWRELPGIMYQGLPIGVCVIAFTMRVAFMNQLLATIAAPSAIAAYSVYQQADDLLCALTIGMADTVATLAGILMGEEDRPKMKKLFFTSIQATIIITLSISAIFFIAAPNFASLYIKDNAQALALATGACRTYAAGMPMYGLSLIYFNYFQGIGKSRLSSICGFFFFFVFLMMCAWVLSFPFGPDAVWLSFPATQILMFCLYGIIVKVSERNNGTKDMSLWDRVLLLPADFDVTDENRIDLSIISSDAESVTDRNVSEISEAVYDFCMSHDSGKRRAIYMALATEEMLGNVITHGFSNDNKVHSVDVRILKKNDDFVLRVRDDCLIFDPLKQLTLFSDEDVIHNIGLRLTVRTAKDFKYSCILKLNNLLVRV